jgi:hypothetical protein
MIDLRSIDWLRKLARYRDAEGGTYGNGGWITFLPVHSLIRRVGSDSDL